MGRGEDDASAQNTAAVADGIADVGFALSAWLVDPHGNTIGLLQFKDEDAE
mgnify:CR=1 FL=1